MDSQGGHKISWGAVIAALALALQTLALGGTIIWQIGDLKSEIRVLQREAQYLNKQYDDLNKIVENLRLRPGRLN